MFIVSTYSLAVVFCIITMICWGSWANSQKMAAKTWRFELFYWDYVIGIVLFSLLLGFTMGSIGEQGRPFIQDLAQASMKNLISPFIGGVIFNLSNILVVAAIALAGMSLGFPVGVGICMVLGVIVNYIATPKGDPILLFIGVGLAVIAIILDALAFRKLSNANSKKPGKALLLAITGGVLMATFFRFVAAGIAPTTENPETGMLTPYSAFFIFALGVLASNFIFNTYLMKKPIEGASIKMVEYFKGGIKNHLSGIIGGMIWSVGTAFSLLAANKAGYAISFGLGQGAIMIGAFWGVFIWKEFKGAPIVVNKYLAAMFLLFIAGLALIVIAGS